MRKPTLHLLALGLTLTACATGSGTMDADAPLRLAPDSQDQSRSGHIFVADPGPDFRFYPWASVVVDGQIVETDYAPDLDWIEYRPQPRQ